MQFSAKIKRTSAVWRNWTTSRRITATLGSIPFRRVPNGDFVSDVLTPDQFVELQHHIAVQLEATGRTVTPLKPSMPKAPEKPPEPAAPYAAKVEPKAPEKPAAPRNIDYRARREARLAAKGR